ncbi:MAG: ribokinase [Clostridia bacterium]|nr:ribokinase [Clostridia bacterium]
MKILNFGSLNIDLVYGVDHHARTGETLTTRAFARHMGGKGLNQSVALSRAGAQVYHAGCIGEDGVFLRDYLAENGVDTKRVRITDEATGHAVIQVNAQGDNCILLYPGANRRQRKEEVRQVLDGFSAGDLLLMQNETNALAEMMHAAKSKGMKIAFNPSPIDETLRDLPLDLVDYFILNEIEGEALSGESDAEKAVQKLLEKYPQAHVVLTLGSKGCMYAHGEKRLRQSAFKVNAVDTTGAGDTFTGYFLASQLRGEDAEKSLKIASAASAIQVTRPGAAQAIPMLEEVIQWLKER